MPYTVKDVVADEQAMTDLQKLGVMTTPVTVFGDEVIVGFDQVKLGALVSVVKREAR